MNPALIALSLMLAAAPPAVTPPDPLALVAPAAPSPTLTDAEASATSTDPGTTAAGFFGFLDPETGRPAGAPEAAGAIAELPGWQLEQAIRTDGVDLLVETDADGVLTVDLQGRFQTAMYGWVGTDGKAVVDHQAPQPSVEIHP